jgi:hypothetical protein
MSTPSEEACGARLVRPEYLTESGYQDRAAALELIGARSRTFVTPIECGADLALVHHRLVFARLHVPSEKSVVLLVGVAPTGMHLFFESLLRGSVPNGATALKVVHCLLACCWRMKCS